MKTKSLEIINSHGDTLQLTIPEIQNLQEAEYKKIPDEYTRNTLVFCRDWLQGKAEFQLQTSGSTGSPKPIFLKREQMRLSALNTINALKLKETYRSLICLNTNYIAGIMMLVRGFESGMKMTIVPPATNPFKLVPSDLHFDFTALVPMQILSILESGDEKMIALLNEMKVIILGGAPVNYKLASLVKQLKVPVYATFGMTETVSHIALKLLNGYESQDYFTVLGETEIEKDERGCLTVVSGVTENKKIITNDLVDIVAPGKFKWLGRIDDIINTGGVKVSPGKIEEAIDAAFLSLQIKRRFFISRKEDEKLGEKVILILEGKPLDQINEENVKSDLLLRLNRFEIPREFFYINQFKETNTGKINKIETLKESAIISRL